MKVKQILHITNPAAFLRGDYDNCLTIYGSPCYVEGWITLGEIEVDISVERAAVIAAATAAIDKEISAEQLRINLLENRKRGVLLLSHGAQL